MSQKAQLLHYWLLAIRPKTLPAAAGPIIVGLGSACAAVGWHQEMLFPLLACFLGSVLLQIGVNLANDYFDFKNEIDSTERLGPVRVTQSGLIPPSQVKQGVILTLTGAAFVFLYLVQRGGWPIAVVGAASLLAALAYSGGPFPLASNGLGELFAFIFFGWVGVGATQYILAGTINWLTFWAALSPGFLISAIMIINNLRDIDTDRKAGKITLAVRLGREKTILLYKTLIFSSYLIPPLFILMNWASLFALFPLSTLWMGMQLCGKVDRNTGFELNELLANTAKLSLLFSILFAAGLIIHF